jgi:hypothetical protein
MESTDRKEINEISDILMRDRMKILDDFAKSFFSSESLMTGKDLIGIIDSFVLNQSTVFENGMMINKHWFTIKEALNENS